MRWVVLYQAIVYACSSLLLSGLIPEWGRWYSERPQHREQVDAFLRGSLAVSQSPSALGLGLAWSEAGVHQVWGLGVPLWHLPFVACSRLFGAADFPDMLSFGIALAL